MEKNQATPDAKPNGQAFPVNRLEVIRFATREDCRRAIGVLLERGMLNYSSSARNEWAVRTDVVRALRAGGVPFEWLTENV